MKTDIEKFAIRQNPSKVLIYLVELRGIEPLTS